MRPCNAGKRVRQAPDATLLNTPGMPNNRSREIVRFQLTTAGAAFGPHGPVLRRPDWKAVILSGIHMSRWRLRLICCSLPLA